MPLDVVGFLVCCGEVTNRPTDIAENRARSIRAAAFDGFYLDEQGPASADKVLERLGEARSQSTKESNRLIVASLCFVLFYFIKLAGLRADIVIFDQKIFAVPYGMFLFCILSQLSMTAGNIRLSDARVFDRLMKGICDTAWPDRSQAIFKTYPNQGIWLDAASSTFSSMKDRTLSRIFFTIFQIPLVLVSLGVLTSPILIGCYFLYDWKREIGTGAVNLQFYSVMTSTALALVWFVNYMLIHVADSDE